MRERTSGIAPRLYQRASEALAADIASGAIAAGAQLTETGVAARFGISRAPARQALAVLEHQGLVRKAKTRGYQVLAAEGSGTPPDRGLPVPRAETGGNIRSQSSWELIYPGIESEIVARTSLASWRINEALLARHHRVSRTVARDVVGRLQQRGIARKDDRGRWYAPALTAKHIDELYELRWVLEPLALEKAFSELPQGFLARLRANVLAAIDTGGAIDGDTLDALEHELHVEMLGYCGNEALMRAISLPQALLVTHHFLYRWTAELFGSEPFLPEHLDIIDRLLASDVPGAKAALVRHLQVSRERAMRRIATVAQALSPDGLPYLERLDET